MISSDSILDVLAALLAALSPGLTTAEGAVVLSDEGAGPPAAIWGKVDCDRHRPGMTPPAEVVPTGGDPRAPGSGTPSENESFRRLTVYDGDDVYGERCELGLNDASTGPTTLYREGDRYLTLASLRLPADLDLDADGWRVLLQMKQAEPYDNPDLASIFELQLRGGRWRLLSDWHQIWSAPARAGTWTRFAFSVTYSKNPGKGSVEVAVDLNGDGRVDERSDLMHLATLRTESPGDPDFGPRAGEAIPSHLRVGIYQDPAYSCPRSGPGCSVDVDAVRVVRLPNRG